MAKLHDALGVMFILLALLPGCQEKPLSASGAATGADPTTAQRELSEVARDTAEAIRAESAILRKALQSMDSLTESDRQAYWSALTQQRQLADEMQAIIMANPTWMKSVCEWFASQIQPADIEAVRLRNTLRDRHSVSQERDDWRQLLLEASGSVDAARAHVGHMMDNPGEPTSLYIMCVKFGFVEDDS